MIGTALWRSCLSYRSQAHTVASWFTRLATCVAVLASASQAAAQVTYEVVADLSSIVAALPLGGLIVGPDGALYGTASAGGHGDGCGVVYRLDASGAVTAVHDFEWPDGCEPVGELVVGPDQGLYGVTRSGGDPQRAGGTVYRLALDGTHTVLHRFILDWLDPSAVFWPAAALLLHPDGFFYGTTASGTIFRISPDGSTFHIVEGFGAIGEPDTLDSPLILGPDGHVYGTAASVLTTLLPASSVFRVTGDGATEIYRFRVTRPPPGVPSMPDGHSPRGLVVGSDGAFYGVTSSGGPTYRSSFRRFGHGLPPGPKWHADHALHLHRRPTRGNAIQQPDTRPRRLSIRHDGRRRPGPQRHDLPGQ